MTTSARLLRNQLKSTSNQSTTWVQPDRATPNSPEPGFLRLYQANTEYVEANLQDWIEREKEKLTEEQLREEYDRRIALGQLKVPVIDESTNESEDTSGDAEGETGEATEENEGGEASDASDRRCQSKTLTPPPSRTAASAEGETSLQLDEPQSSDAGDSDSTDDGQPTADDQSSIAEPTTSHLVSFVQDGEPQAEEESGTADNAVDEEASAEDVAEGVEAAVEDDVLGPLEVRTPEPGLPPSPVDPSMPRMRTQTFEEARDTIADSLGARRCHSGSR